MLDHETALALSNPDHLDQHLKDHFYKLTRRTNYPKLGYFIHVLNENSITCILYGVFRHAPMLWVEKKYFSKAYKLIAAHGDNDDIHDAEHYESYAKVQPDAFLYFE